MAGIAFNLTLIRVGQNRTDVDKRNHPDTQWAKMELSALQVNAPANRSALPQDLDQPLGDSEVSQP